MRNLIQRASGALLLTLPFASCYTVDHFMGDQTRYDGLYFGAQEDAPLQPVVHDVKWRNYAVLGLVPWDETQIRFAGERLSQIGAERRPMKITVRSEEHIYNGLVKWGLGTLTGGISSFIYVPRCIEVDGWNME